MSKKLYQKIKNTVQRLLKFITKKNESRRVAIEGRRCMDKMIGDSRQDIINVLSDIEAINSKFDEQFLQSTQSLLDNAEEQQSCSNPNKDSQLDENLIQKTKSLLTIAPEEGPRCSNSLMDTEISDLAITKSTNCLINNGQLMANHSVQDISKSVKVKKEVVSAVTKKITKNNKFTEEEDVFIRKGIEKYGNKAWAAILKDPNFHFHPSRTRDALRMRADTNAFKKQVECVHID